MRVCPAGGSDDRWVGLGIRSRAGVWQNADPRASAPTGRARLAATGAGVRGLRNPQSGRVVDGSRRQTWTAEVRVLVSYDPFDDWDRFLGEVMTNVDGPLPR
jgi:hypothetical protein